MFGHLRILFLQLHLFLKILCILLQFLLLLLLLLLRLIFKLSLLLSPQMRLFLHHLLVYELFVLSLFNLLV